MAIKKRLKVSDKRNAVLRLKSESIEQVAASYGVTTMTIRNWVDTYGTPVPAVKSPPLLQQRVELVPLPQSPEAGGASAEPDPDDGGYDAARAAAGLGPEPKPEENPPPPPDEKPKVPDIPPEQALVFMSEMALQVSVRFYAARCKVKLDDELKALAKLTPQERADLETYAPFAAPFISEMLLKYGKYIGAGIYGFLYFTMLTDRFAAIKERAPKKEIDAAGTVK